MILICYDGSADARAAIERVAHLHPGTETTVLTVWEPWIEIVTAMGTGMGWMPAATDAEEVDRSAADAAHRRAEVGAELARSLGLRARARIEPRHGSVPEAILRVADDVDAEVIAMGTRGLGGLRSMILGSVSHAVAQHADRPVLIAPSAAMAERRTERRHEDSAVAS